MTLRLLPNYFKKIGLGLFLLTVWPDMIRGFIDGYNDGAEDQKIAALAEFNFLGLRIFSESFFELFSLLSVVGLVIYALSKDKVFDELLVKLRLESMHLTFFLSVIVILMVLLFNSDTDIAALYLIDLQVICFLVTYKIKKVNMTPDGVEGYE